MKVISYNQGFTEEATSRLVGSMDMQEGLPLLPWQQLRFQRDISLAKVPLEKLRVLTPSQASQSWEELPT